MLLSFNMSKFLACFLFASEIRWWPLSACGQNAAIGFRKEINYCSGDRMRCGDFVDAGWGETAAERKKVSESVRKAPPGKCISHTDGSSSASPMDRWSIQQGLLDMGTGSIYFEYWIGRFWIVWTKSFFLYVWQHRDHRPAISHDRRVEEGLV